MIEQFCVFIKRGVIKSVRNLVFYRYRLKDVRNTDNDHTEESKGEMLCPGKPPISKNV